MSFYRRQVCDCGKPLLWARTERNRWIPLDPKPNPDGNQAAWEDSDGVWKTRQIGKNSDPPWDFERMFMPHVGTCELVKERREAARQASQPAPENVVPHSAFLARLRARGRR